MSRKEEREQAFCLVFQDIFNSEDAIETYEENFDIVGDYAKVLYKGVISDKENLDSYIEKYSKTRKVNRIPKVNLAILRLALYEILYIDDVPNSVAINEAVEIAKKYSGQDDFSFINGLLGAVVKEID